MARSADGRPAARRDSTWTRWRAALGAGRWRRRSRIEIARAGLLLGQDPLHQGFGLLRRDARLGRHRHLLQLPPPPLITFSIKLLMAASSLA